MLVASYMCILNWAESVYEDKVVNTEGSHAQSIMDYSSNTEGSHAQSIMDYSSNTEGSHTQSIMDYSSNMEGSHAQSIMDYSSNIVEPVPIPIWEWAQCIISYIQ